MAHIVAWAVSITGAPLRSRTARSQRTWPTLGTGGIQNLSGTLTVTNIAFLSNSGGRHFGADAIALFGGALTVKNSEFSDNTGVQGAAIWNCAGAGAAIVKNSTITNNTASAQGGGIFNCAGSTTILKNTTVEGKVPDDIVP